MNRSRFLQFPVLASMALILTVFSAGCSNSSKTSAEFTSSATAATPGLVKLVQKARSGSRVVVDAIVFGPEPTLDLFAFKFGIAIGDPSLVSFVPQAAYNQNALVAGAGQTISIDVDGASDPSIVQIDIEKLGGGAGNGVAAQSAVVIELAFDVQGEGGTTLTLVGLGNNPPVALDSTRAPLAAVRFDAASAGVRGVKTGGSGY